MAKNARNKVELRSSESPHFRTTTVAKNATKKIEKSMYDPIVRKHVMYKEGKIRK